jgi:hypothetical protein
MQAVSFLAFGFQLYLLHKADRIPETANPARKS